MPSTQTSMLDGLSTSVAVKAPCVAVETSNITLAGLQGYAEGDRVLCVAQTDASTNGIYSASSGQWQRTLDADGNRDLVQGTRVLIRGDSTDAVEYVLTTPDPIVIGTSLLTFQLRYGANAVYDRTESEIAAGVTPVNYGREPGDIRRYGAVGDNSTDNATAIQSAIDVAEVAGGRVYIPAGIFRYASGLVFSSQAYAVHMYGESLTGSVLRKAFSGTGIELVDFARPLFENFTADKTGSDSGVGIKVTKSHRGVLRDLIVTGHGSHGVELVECNLLRVDSVISILNGGDGLKFSGSTPTPDNNACVIINLDSRGNTGWGLNIASGWANFIFGATLQQNVGGGINFGSNARQNIVYAYSEANTGADINFTDNTECKGNALYITHSDDAPVFGGTTATTNTVFKTKRGSVFDPSYTRLVAQLFQVPNVMPDGTAVTGTLELSHPANHEFRFTLDGASSDQTVSFVNASGSHKANVEADAFVVTKAASSAGAGKVVIGATHATTVGAAGGATALPATPLGYLICNVEGTAVKIPYYTAS